MNEKILADFFEYLKTILNYFDIQNIKDQKTEEILNKKLCKNVQEITNIFKEDYKLELELDIINKNKEIDNIKISHNKGILILRNAQEQLFLLDQIKKDEFNNKLLYFYQTQNLTQSKGDKVIIKEYSEKPKKIEFVNLGLKQKVLGTDQNFYRNLYRASGYVTYKDDKIKSYVVTSIDIVESNNNDK